MISLEIFIRADDYGVLARTIHIILDTAAVGKYAWFSNLQWTGFRCLLFYVNIFFKDEHFSEIFSDICSVYSYTIDIIGFH